MDSIRTYRWFGVAALALAMIALVWPMQGIAVNRDVQLDSETETWLDEADASATETFLVLLRDDGTQARVNEAQVMSDKVTRRTHVHTVLSERAESNDRVLRAMLGKRGVMDEVQSLQVFQSVNGFSITGTKAVVEALESWNLVESIDMEMTIQLDQPFAAEPLNQINAVEWNISKIGADQVQSDLGIDGSGVVVGGMDTGVRETHETLAGNYKCSGTSDSACWLDAVNGQSAPYDDQGHGSHTMGTAVGSEGIGVAPGAEWIACKAFNQFGGANGTDILECFDFFLAPGGDPANAPDIVVNSWGNSNGSFSGYQQAVTNWVNAGIYPEFSNGNSGPSCGTVGAPASYSNAVGTGATDINDTIASFSSRGPSPFGGIGKPDVSAPGVSIRSAWQNGDSSYNTISGTSMAGPHAAGLAALLLEADPTLSIDALTQNMKDNAVGIPASGCGSSGVPNNIYGWGRIDALASVQAALGGGGPAPTPTPPPSGSTVFADDFETVQSWTANPGGADAATTGLWERGNPEGTDITGPKQLDATASGSNALVTGASAGSSVGANDIDNGVTSIRSPDFTLTGSSSYDLSFSYYFAHYTNSSSDDFLRVKVVGSSTTTVFEELGAGNDDDAAWESTTVSLDAFAGQTVYLLIEAADAGTASLVEAAIDDIEVTGS
ncbi:MAG: S8 family serine peptidase [Chloroflexota bacterium]